MSDTKTKGSPLHIAEPSKKPMKCPICDVSDKWQDLSHMRNNEYWYDLDRLDYGKDTGFQICMNCAYVTYYNVEAEADVKKFYSEHSSGSSGGAHFVTCNRKNEYNKNSLD